MEEGTERKPVSKGAQSIFSSSSVSSSAEPSSSIRIEPVSGSFVKLSQLDFAIRKTSAELRSPVGQLVIGLQFLQKSHKYIQRSSIEWFGHEKLGPSSSQDQDAEVNICVSLRSRRSGVQIPAGPPQFLSGSLFLDSNKRCPARARKESYHYG